MSFWLLKSEPFKYSWEQLVQDGRTHWDGVRNYAARIHLNAMQPGDLCLYYHSNKGLEVVGVAEVARSAYQDPTTDDERWVCVDVVPRRALKQPVPLAVLKQDRRTRDMQMVRMSRLSVSPVSEREFQAVMELGGTTPPRPQHRRKPA